MGYYSDHLFLYKDFFNNCHASFIYGDNDSCSIPVQTVLEDRNWLLVSSSEGKGEFKILGSMYGLEVMHNDLHKPQLVYSPLSLEKTHLFYGDPDAKITLMPINSNANNFWMRALTDPHFRHSPDCHLSFTLPKGTLISKLP